MTLKTAAVIALAGMVLLTALIAVDFINNAIAVARGLVPDMTLFRSLIYLVASACVLIFFIVFQKRQA